MRNPTECLATAAQLQDTAEICLDPLTRESYAHLALQWRALAQQAAHQDAMEHRLGAADPT